MTRPAIPLPCSAGDLDAVLGRHAPHERRRLRAEPFLERLRRCRATGAVAGAALGEAVRGRRVCRTARRCWPTGGGLRRRRSTVAAAGAGAGAAGASRPRSHPSRDAPPACRTGTVCPSFTRISASTPLTGAGISASTLSVEISNIGSSRLTESPTFLSHFDSVPSAIDSPIWGITTSTRATASPSLRVLRASPPAREQPDRDRREQHEPDDRPDQPIRHPPTRRARFGIGRAPRQRAGDLGHEHGDHPAAGEAADGRNTSDTKICGPRRGRSLRRGRLAWRMRHRRRGARRESVARRQPVCRVVGAVKCNEEFLDVSIETALAHLVGLDLHERVVSAFGAHRQAQRAERACVRPRLRAPSCAARGRSPGRTRRRRRARPPVPCGCDRSVASGGVRGSFVEHVLHPVGALERMQRVAAEANRHRPRAGDDEVQLRVIRADLRAVREAVVRLGLRPVGRFFLDRLAGEELPFASSRSAGASSGRRPGSCSGCRRARAAAPGRA